VARLFWNVQGQTPHKICTHFSIRNHCDTASDIRWVSGSDSGASRPSPAGPANVLPSVRDRIYRVVGTLQHYSLATFVR